MAESFGLPPMTDAIVLTNITLPTAGMKGTWHVAADHVHAGGGTDRGKSGAGRAFTD
jgi:hypothetical protein